MNCRGSSALVCTRGNLLTVSTKSIHPTDTGGTNGCHDEGDGDVESQVCANEIRQAHARPCLTTISAHCPPTDLLGELLQPRHEANGSILPCLSGYSNNRCSFTAGYCIHSSGWITVTP
jgi:hypothetical protein